MLNPKQIDDLVKTTQDLLIKQGAFVDLMSDLTDYVAVNKLFKNHKKVFDGGLDWKFDAIVDHNHSAKFTGLYANDGAALNDATIDGKVSPRFVTANYIYDVLEPKLQGSKIMVVDYVKSKMHRMYVSYFELLEAAFWGKPEDSNDKFTPYGIPFWITKQSNVDAASHATGGFDGKNPTGFSEGRAGISSTAYPRWANWACQYSAVSDDDLVSKMCRGVRKTNFKSAISHAEPTLSSGNGVYTNDSVIDALSMLLKKNNMNLGNDIASKDGQAVFKSHPIEYVPALDTDTTNPIYLIDWKSMAFGTISGWDRHLSEPKDVPGKHTVRQVFLDGGVNMICDNLRKQAVFHLALS